jgi:ADP-ribose pyrophosphatase
MGRHAEELWDRLDVTVLHHGRTKIVEYGVRLPSGEIGRFEVDESIPFAVAALIRDGSRVVLSRQYRFPVDQWIHDLPGGAGEVGETAREAVEREVREEVGLALTELVELQSFYPNPGRSAWPVHLFFGVAAGASPGELHDPWERVTTERLEIAEVRRMIAAGEIVDPALLIAWQRASLEKLLD